MNIRELMSQMQTGMPSGPVESAQDTAAATQQAPKKKHKNPTAHLAKAHKAAKAGDHGTAKKHALAAVNLLHRMASTPAPAAPAPAAPAVPPAP